MIKDLISSIAPRKSLYMDPWLWTATQNKTCDHAAQCPSKSAQHREELFDPWDVAVHTLNGKVLQYNKCSNHNHKELHHPFLFFLPNLLHYNEQLVERRILHLVCQNDANHAHLVCFLFSHMKRRDWWVVYLQNIVFWLYGSHSTRTDSWKNGSLSRSPVFSNEINYREGTLAVDILSKLYMYWKKGTKLWLIYPNTVVKFRDASTFPVTVWYSPSRLIIFISEAWVLLLAARLQWKAAPAVSFGKCYPQYSTWSLPNGLSALHLSRPRACNFGASFGV